MRWPVLLRRTVLPAAALLALALLAGGCFLPPLFPTPSPFQEPTAAPSAWSFDDEALQKALRAGIEAGSASIDLRALRIPDTYQDQVHAAYSLLIESEPSAYLCRPTLEFDLSSIDDGKTWTIQGVRPEYQPASVVAEADKWIDAMDLTDKSPFERARLLHDAIVLRSFYDEAAAKANRTDDPAFSAAGILFGGKAICQGYAEAYAILLNRAGVPAVRVSGTSNGVSHAWVVVSIEGIWYHADPTYDDPVPDAPGQTNYTYFLLSDRQIGKDHRRDHAEPACTDETYAWMHHMEHAVRFEDGRYAFSDPNDDGNVWICDADGGSAGKVPFRIYGETHASTRGFYLCLTPSGTLYLSNFSEGASVYRMAPGAKVLEPFQPDGQPDGIHPAKNLRIDGKWLRYDLMDEQGRTVGSYETAYE